MDTIWTTLGIEPTKDVSAIKRAYAEKAKTCHPEEDPEGFMKLRQAYQAALDYAEGTREEPGFSLAGPGPDEIPIPENGKVTEDPGWYLQEQEDEGPNPFEGGEAITKFLELYTGKQRKNPAMWMDYVTSAAFLDAAWDPRFTSLLLQKVRELRGDFPPNKEFLTWLNVAYQFSGGEARSFDGMKDILQIAALGPAPKTPKGNEFAILQSFLDYRRLNGLAAAGRWDQEAIEAFRQVLNSYAPAYIRERCEQRVTPDCERHPAGLRVFIHFLKREDLPEEVYRSAWQRLDLKSAVLGRAKVLYGPIRELAVQRVPGIGGEVPVNFLQLNRNLDAYQKRIRMAPETEPSESEAFFQTQEMQRALPVPRFLEEQLLTYSPWRRESMGETLVRRMLEYYQEHADIPRAEEVISGLKEDLRLCEARRWSQEDDAADPEGIPYYERLTLRHRPFFRWWLNTAFYTARDPDTGAPLLKYLEKYLPYQAGWSRRFTEWADGTPRTIAAAMGTVEIDCYPLHLEYRVNGKPVYRPCLTWEQTAQESGDWFALLLPITAAPYKDFDRVAEEIFRRLDYLPVPEEDRALIVWCLAGHVCRLPLDQETGEPMPPEKAFPLELSMEGGGKLYTAEWTEDEAAVTIYRQTFSGRRVQEQLLPDVNGTWTAVPGSVKRTPDHEKDFPPIRFTADSGFEAARRRLAELTDPRFFDLSRLRELPWKIFYTPVGGVEEGLSHIDILREPPKVNAEAFLAEWEEAGEIPADMEPIIAKVRQAVEEQPKEEEPIPPEILVTGEALSALLCHFSQDELERLEMEWMEGRLVLRQDGGKYACLYFENSFGGGGELVCPAGRRGNLQDRGLRRHRLRALRHGEAGGILHLPQRPGPSPGHGSGPGPDGLGTAPGRRTGGLALELRREPPRPQAQGPHGPAEAGRRPGGAGEELQPGKIRPQPPRHGAGDCGPQRRADGHGAEKRQLRPCGGGAGPLHDGQAGGRPCQLALPPGGRGNRASASGAFTGPRKLHDALAGGRRPPGPGLRIGRTPAVYGPRPSGLFGP